MNAVLKHTSPVRDEEATLKLFKALSQNLRKRYGTHRTKHTAPLASADNYAMMGDVPATFTSVAFYFYYKCYSTIAIRSARGALWLEFYKTMTFKGKPIRKGNSTEITSIEQLSEILEWITGEKDILCKNDDQWEYADEFHLWTFQT